MNKISNPSPNAVTVIDVYSDNFETEMINIESAINKGYNVVSIDTEYPGVIIKQKYSERTTTSIYNTMKANVDKLKPIQIGISLSDIEGKRPSNAHIWQFNFKFDCKIDEYERSSIKLLEEAKIPFQLLLKNGIDNTVFRNKFKNSCLFANLKICWVSFHGAYDFAYLIKVLSSELLPPTLKEFNEIRKSICPILYDVKMLIQVNDTFRNYSLCKLAKIYKIETSGILHQAGTDAFITSELFFKIKQCLFDHKIKKFENKLYGLSKMFSVDSAEFESKNKKQSLAERIKLLKEKKETADDYQIEEEMMMNQMYYGVTYVPVYYDPYYVMNANLSYVYRTS